MDWLHETHRKIYTRVDGRWTRHPLSARGLGSELLKYVDEDGCIYLAPGESPAEGIFRTLQAHPAERKRVAKDVAALLEDLAHDPAYLVHEKTLNRVRIRNFIPAQGIVQMTPEERSDLRSKEAQRAAEYRKRKKAEREAQDAGETGGSPPSGSSERHDERHDGDRDDRHDANPDDRHDGERDGEQDASRAGDAGTHARDAGAPPGASRSVPSVPSSSPPPPPPAREGLNEDLVWGVSDAEDIFGAYEGAIPTVERLDRKLASMEPENVWPDLRGEISEWIAHVRREAAKAKQRGVPWTPDVALTELESKATQRIRYRPGDARKERERNRAATPTGPRGQPVRASSGSGVDLDHERQQRQRTRNRASGEE